MSSSTNEGSTYREPPLTLAIPSKGRLRSEGISTLSAAGYHLNSDDNSRGYRTTIANHPEFEICFMSAADIASALSKGQVDVGITGRDLLIEICGGELTEHSSVAIHSDLDFGHTNLVIAVPASWIDVDTLRDFEDLTYTFRQRYGRRIRIATKYEQTLRHFLTSHGISDYRIIDNSGATEGTPAAGLAEAIADLTTTGATLDANDLRILEDGIVIRSSAVIAQSRLVQFSPEQSVILKTLLTSLAVSSDKNRPSN